MPIFAFNGRENTQKLAQFGAIGTENLRDLQAGGVAAAQSGLMMPPKSQFDATKAQHWSVEVSVMQQDSQPINPADLFAVVSLLRRSKLAEARAKILLDLKRKGLLAELQKALNDYDMAVRVFLLKRLGVVEALVKVTKSIPKEYRNDKWLWRELMRSVGFDPALYVSPIHKSLRHLRRQARKLADIVRDDDPNLSRAILKAYATGVVKIADRLPHPRSDGVEREVAEMLSKLASLYAAGHFWVLSRLREVTEKLEEHWKSLHSG